MLSYVKIKSSRNGEITLFFTDISKSCPSPTFLTLQICLLTVFTKISVFTVVNKFPRVNVLKKIMAFCCLYLSEMLVIQAGN